jgi:hypothetical protein
MKRNYLFLMAALLLSLFANAQDRVFTHTYQSNVLPLHTRELEYWATLRSGKQTFYNAVDQRFELEVGVGKNWQTAFYFNTSTEVFQGAFGLERSNSIGFSNEWKWKMSDPVANKIGSSLYGEVGYDGEELELEGKLILDKKVGKNLFALNLVAEYEMKAEYKVKSNGQAEVEMESEMPFELDLGWMHFCGQHSGIGLEMRNHNENGEEGWESSALYLGPTFHFNGNGWFINFSGMPQLTNLHKEEGDKESLDLVQHEKFEARVLVSFAF